MADSLGAQIPADGHSRPYLATIAAATVLYGFLGLLLAFDLARRYAGDSWAFLATLGIWFASSLPVYMYFNPAWSHAHSAFSVALFLWYWQRTRDQRTLRQWIVLGLAAGLMMNVYYPNAILLLVPGIEALAEYRRALRPAADRLARWGGLIQCHACFLGVVLVALLPTLLTRLVVYGSPFESGYPPMGEWHWTSPVWLSVLFSANHGLLSWTPVLIPALLGLFWVWRKDGLLGGGLLLSVLAYGYFIASYPDWDGMSSFGNRFFVSLTPVFVIGLASAARSLCALVEPAGKRRGAGRRRLGAAESVECRFYLPMGNADDPGARAHLLETDGAQPACRGARAGRGRVGALRIYAGTR